MAGNKQANYHLRNSWYCSSSAPSKKPLLLACFEGHQRETTRLSSWRKINISVVHSHEYFIIPKSLSLVSQKAGPKTQRSTTIGANDDLPQNGIPLVLSHGHIENTGTLTSSGAPLQSTRGEMKQSVARAASPSRPQNHIPNFVRLILTCAPPKSQSKCTPPKSQSKCTPPKSQSK